MPTGASCCRTQAIGGQIAYSVPHLPPYPAEFQNLDSSMQPAVRMNLHGDLPKRAARQDGNCLATHGQRNDEIGSLPPGPPRRVVARKELRARFSRGYKEALELAGRKPGESALDYHLLRSCFCQLQVQCHLIDGVELPIALLLQQWTPHSSL